ncbi:Protein of unknown function (DUF506) [Quillaja saponaria]|uniref:Uncharacterized protein n=1 Tax=Quillaja saponaria TaxID=32244 RepID=A0AAD7VLM3_QUISA|nr:Protein of unknown function (DUF506) [Quillaja saponaria]
MPPMKIQPIDIDSQQLNEAARTDSAKPVLKSRLKRLFVFDRQLPSVLRTSAAEKPTFGEAQYNKDGRMEFEPSSVALAKMVQNFIEDSNEKQPSVAKCGRNRCNCFNGKSNDSSDDEFDVFGGFGESITSGSPGDASDVLKSLIPCATVAERNILADTAKIVEKNNKLYKRKEDLRKIVTDGLSSLGYDSSICKSKWDKSPSYPAGEYEYTDVVIEGERLLVDVDFRSEFEIARPTGTYKGILQSIPYIFVGKSDRLRQIVSIVSEAAKQSLKKKGMHFPPWRKAEYMRAKWLSPYTRATQLPSFSVRTDVVPETKDLNKNDLVSVAAESDCGELELIFGENTTLSEADPGEDEKPKEVVVSTWKPPAFKLKHVERGTMIVTGLASLLKEKP